MYGWQIKLCDLLLTHVIPEHLKRWVAHYKVLYK